MDYKEASKLVADVNQILQDEIDKLQQAEDAAAAEMPMPEEAAETEPEEIGAEEIEAALDLDLVKEMVNEDEQAAELPEEPTVPEAVLEPTIDLASEAAPEISPEPEARDAVEAAEEPEQELPTIEEVRLEDEEVAAFVDEKVLEKAIADEIPVRELSPEEKKIFSYFMPISGMESSICQALTGARYRLEKNEHSSTGNIIIQGGRGCGKTMMAGSLVKVLQKEIGKPRGSVGKIDGKKLNQKDLQALFQKVRGGCLIIENAGGIERSTAVTLSLLMESDASGLLVILEDTREGIERVLSQDASFAKKFTEKITIPVFTIDELVNFGKTYAREMDCVIDEVAVLAMYNRINLIQRVDHATSLTEVKEIMDEAIENAQRGGLRAIFGRIGTKKYDEEGNLILREKDFEV